MIMVLGPHKKKSEARVDVEAEKAKKLAEHEAEQEAERQERAAQLKQHEAVLAQADATEGAVLLLGDFNTLARESQLAARGLLEARGYKTPLPTGTGTWRSGPIRLHTDWIFVRRARVIRWGVARRLGVSDHWPVWAEVAPEED